MGFTAFAVDHFFDQSSITQWQLLLVDCLFTFVSAYTLAIISIILAHPDTSNFFRKHPVMWTAIFGMPVLIWGKIVINSKLGLHFDLPIVPIILVAGLIIIFHRMIFTRYADLYNHWLADRKYR